MRFMLLYKPGRETDAPASPQARANLRRVIEEMAHAGVLWATGGLQPSAVGVRVRKSGDEIVVTHGPFAETAEVISGFAIVEAAATEDAIELAARFLDVVGEGVSEMRPMLGARELAAV